MYTPFLWCRLWCHSSRWITQCMLLVRTAIKKQWPPRARDSEFVEQKPSFARPHETLDGKPYSACSEDIGPDNEMKELEPLIDAVPYHWVLDVLFAYAQGQGSTHQKISISKSVFGYSSDASPRSSCFVQNSHIQWARFTKEMRVIWTLAWPKFLNTWKHWYMYSIHWTIYPPTSG